MYKRAVDANSISVVINGIHSVRTYPVSVPDVYQYFTTLFCLFTVRCFLIGLLHVTVQLMKYVCTHICTIN